MHNGIFAHVEVHCSGTLNNVIIDRLVIVNLGNVFYVDTVECGLYVEVVSSMTFP